MLNIFWFRKDLRIDDNRGLQFFIESLLPESKYSLIYIKNKNTYNFYGKNRIIFLNECLAELKTDLEKKGLTLQIFYGNSIDIFTKINHLFGKLNVFANGQCEPYSGVRDSKIEKLIKSTGGNLNLFSDSTIFDLNHIIKDDGNPYSVFTPFKIKLLKNLQEDNYQHIKVDLKKLNKDNQTGIGISEKYYVSRYKLTGSFKKIFTGGRKEAKKNLLNFCKNNISQYHLERDYPYLNSTSLLSPHIHFGTISIRECFREALKNKNEGITTWINELIWREFYYNISFHFPYISRFSFKKKFDNLDWNDDSEKIVKWKEGLTGYPIIDAGMRQLKSTGWMHNRLRMLTAMFLTKDLSVNWRVGERYFAEYLIDFDFSSNNGGWQWSASTGCDAQPYFRIFNPYLQSKKFDYEGKFIKKYIPELKSLPYPYYHDPSELDKSQGLMYNFNSGKDYPIPIVNHSEAKDLSIAKFKLIK